MKSYSLSFGQSIGYKHPAPERTAKRMGSRLGDPDTFQVWTNRVAMARSIRMQQNRAPKSSDWRPLVPLSDGEGF